MKIVCSQSPPPSSLPCILLNQSHSPSNVYNAIALNSARPMLRTKTLDLAIRLAFWRKVFQRTLLSLMMEKVYEWRVFLVYYRHCSICFFLAQDTRSDTLTTHLIKRGYPHRFIKEIEKVRQIPRSKALETSMMNQSNRIPFVITFNPALPNIRRIIFNNLNILRSSQRCKAAFPSPPLISYRRCSNLRDMPVPVRAKHHRPPPKTPGAFRCNRKRCKTVLHLFLYIWTTTIRHHITCSSSNLKYMIQCSKCNMQYIGETKRHLSDRFGEQTHNRESHSTTSPPLFPTILVLLDIPSTI